MSKLAIEYIKKVAQQVIDDCNAGCDDESGLELFAKASQEYLDRNKHLSGEEVAKVLGIGYSTLTLYIRKGIISKGIKEVGKPVYWIKWKVQKEYDNYKAKKMS